jgi:transposase
MKTFRPYQPDQLLLLPPNLNEWLPEDHLASFVSEAVDEFALKNIYADYEKGGVGGQPPYDPRMMVKLLLYGYCTGCQSSRKIEQATWEDVGFRVLAANQHPDHDSIATFRKRHLSSLQDLFMQTLKLAQKAGLVKMGHVALDSTLIRANASKHKAMSYERMKETEKRLKGEIEELFKRAEAIDEEEDRKYGKGNKGYGLPEELKRRETRLKKIREAKKELEQEAQEAFEKQQAELEAQAKQKARGRQPRKRIRKKKQKPTPKAQRNFTDPDSRILRSSNSKSFEQCYRAQAVVDSANQIVLAVSVSHDADDTKHLIPMLQRTRKNTRKSPKRLSADSGYSSHDNITNRSIGSTELYIPSRKGKHGQTPAPVRGRPPDNITAIERMDRKLRTQAGKSVYKRRKAIVEPVFGQIKERQRFRMFSFRGLDQVEAEWGLVCAAHNLMKIYRSGWQF